MSFPDPVYMDNLDEDAVTPSVFNKRAQHLSHMLDRFWQRWRSEYLLELRDAHRYSQGCTDNSHVSVGDIIVMRTEGQPRGFWKLAKVERTITGQDGVTRRAVVKVAHSSLWKLTDRLKILNIIEVKLLNVIVLTVQRAPTMIKSMWTLSLKMKQFHQTSVLKMRRLQTYNSSPAQMES